MTITPGSRYEDADQAWVKIHVYDVFENPRFVDNAPQTLVFASENHTALYMVTTLPLPPVPPAEYYAKDGEHMPFLAFKFMEDSTQWWRIAEVNPSVWYPLDMKQGEYLRVPS